MSPRHMKGSHETCLAVREVLNRVGDKWSVLIVGILEDGPKRFVDLMAATGTRDGREVVRWLEDVAAMRALMRDGEGRYAFA